jgi:2-furoyl-CoA dehydrogenase large subunit
VVEIQLPLTPSRALALIGADEPPPPAALAAAMAAEPAQPVRGGLALQARGHVDIAAPPDRVFAVLLDPAALARVIPGCHALDQTGPNQYRADVTVGVGLVKARYAARIALSEIDAPRSLRLAGDGQSTLGTGAGSGVVRLEATANGTRLHYDYAAQVGGKVAAVGSRMLEGAARIVLAQLFDSLGRQALGEGNAPQARRTLWQRLLQALGVAK